MWCVCFSVFLLETTRFIWNGWAVTFSLFTEALVLLLYVAAININGRCVQRGEIKCLDFHASGRQLYLKRGSNEEHFLLYANPSCNKYRLGNEVLQHPASAGNYTPKPPGQCVWQKLAVLYPQTTIFCFCMQITVQNSLWTNSNRTWQLGNISTDQPGRVSLGKDIPSLVFTY